MKSIRLLIPFLFFLPVMSITLFAQNQSKLVQMDENGKLLYQPYTDKGDIIPDFSYCGYMQGQAPIPDIPVVFICCPTGGADDTPYLQSVIDSLASRQPDGAGFRGAILLRKGVYRLASPLRLTVGGIVLRGEGNDKESGTVLLSTATKSGNVLEIGSKGRRKLLKASQTEISGNYTPSGTRTLVLSQADTQFKKGDQIAVVRPSTAEWIRAIGMDSIPPRPQKGETTREAFHRFRREGAATDMNGTVQWKPGTKDLVFERTIVAVESDKVTLDIPLTNALQKEFGGGFVYKYSFEERISHCGIENLYGMTLYDETVRAQDEYIGSYCADENHADVFIACQAVENAWIRNVSVEHFDRCVSISPSAKFITGQDLSAVNPISVITGGRRYGFDINGSLSLFQRCYARDHRHAFVLGAIAAGPNAFVDCKGENLFSSSEPHQRWAAGCLFDNIVLSGYNPALVALNRGNMGSGHGWAGAQMVFWNCSSPLIMVAQPPTAQNFSIGFSGYQPNEYTDKARNITIRSFNNAGMCRFEYNGCPVIGDGWIEYPDKVVASKSLYYRQLYDRVGAEGVKKLMPVSQYRKFFE